MALSVVCSSAIARWVSERAQVQSCCHVVDEPGDEFVVSVGVFVDRVAPVLAVKHREELAHDLVTLFGGASALLRCLGRQVVGEERGVEVPVRGRSLPAEVRHVCGEDDGCRWIVLEGHTHAVAVGHGAQQSTGVIDQVVVDPIGAGDRFVQVSRGGDLAGKVAVEEVSVAGMAKQPPTACVGPVPAEFLDDVDPAPAGDTLGQPQQGLPPPVRRRSAFAAKGPKVFDSSPMVWISGTSSSAQSVASSANPTRAELRSVLCRTSHRPVCCTRRRSARSAAAAMWSLSWIGTPASLNASASSLAGASASPKCLSRMAATSAPRSRRSSWIRD